MFALTEVKLLSCKLRKVFENTKPLEREHYTSRASKNKSNKPTGDPLKRLLKLSKMQVDGEICLAQA